MTSLTTSTLQRFTRYWSKMSRFGAPRILKSSLTAVLICSASYALGSARYDEKRFATQLSRTIKVGIPVQLPMKKDSFFAIYTEASTPLSRGGVILLHGLGAHPDWPQMISPLRRQLPDYGWHTLSIHLNLLPNTATLHDYDHLYRDTHLRIQTAIDFLKQKGIYNIVIIGHSLGASMGLTYTTSEIGKSSGIIAFVGIAMYDPTNISEQFSTATSIGSTNIPILDIFGSLDTIEIMESAAARNNAAKKEDNKRLTQVKVTSADHFFTGLENKLIKRVRLWLNKRAPSRVIDSSIQKTK